MKCLLKFKFKFFKLNKNKAFDFKEVALIVLEKNGHSCLFWFHV